MNEARFVIRRHRRPWGTRYTFMLIAPNGETLPDVYTSKQGAKRGIAAVKNYAADAPIVDMTA